MNSSFSQFPEQGGNYDSRFDVDKGTGTIIVARPLDAEQKSNYNLTVEATDGTRSISTQVMDFLVKQLQKKGFVAGGWGRCCIFSSLFFSSWTMNMVYIN